jgi:hypothetical protein
MQCIAKEAVSDEDLMEAAHFSKFAFAAYGYMLYIWSKPQYKYVVHSCQHLSWHAMCSPFLPMQALLLMESSSARAHCESSPVQGHRYWCS